ncbi:MAG: site-2 protease family protein [Candidatus Zapsychrus exili]|nr:site-2 protease family protein [Candidatus Zapsychrus exili]
MAIEIIKIILILFSSIILHECAHGFSAYKLGDSTAKLAGRLTLNPLKHIDIIGTILLPGALLTMRFMGYNVFVFGWAKPVPVNFRALNNPKRDMMWVGLSGPLTNIILAVFFSQLLKLDISASNHQMLELAVFINLLLATFNLIPIPPLDGSRVVMGLLPRGLDLLYAKLERYGILIVFGLIYLGAFRKILMPIIESAGKFLGVTF